MRDGGPARASGMLPVVPRTQAPPAPYASRCARLDAPRARHVCDYARRDAAPARHASVVRAPTQSKRGTFPIARHEAAWYGTPTVLRDPTLPERGTPACVSTRRGLERGTLTVARPDAPPARHAPGCAWHEDAFDAAGGQCRAARRPPARHALRSTRREAPVGAARPPLCAARDVLGAACRRTNAAGRPPARHAPVLRGTSHSWRGPTATVAPPDARQRGTLRVVRGTNAFGAARLAQFARRSRWQRGTTRWQPSTRARNNQFLISLPISVFSEPDTKTEMKKGRARFITLIS